MPRIILTGVLGAMAQTSPGKSVDRLMSRTGIRFNVEVGLRWVDAEEGMGDVYDRYISDHGHNPGQGFR